MRHVIEQLQGMGFQVVADGDAITWRWQGVGLPDPAKARLLIESLKGHKAEALEILRAEVDLSVALADWPEEWRECWEERAAIREYDGGLERSEAERKATEELARESYQRTTGRRGVQ